MTCPRLKTQLQAIVVDLLESETSVGIGPQSHGADLDFGSRARSGDDHIATGEGLIEQSRHEPPIRRPGGSFCASAGSARAAATMATSQARVR